MTTIPMSEPIQRIVDAVRAARDHYSAGAEHLAVSILSGDAAALAEGIDIRRGFEWLADEMTTLATLSGADHVKDEVDTLTLAAVLGVREVDDAVEIASGMHTPDDDVLAERFKSARLDLARRQREMWIERHETDPDYASADFVARCRADLDLIAAGVEPE